MDYGEFMHWVGCVDVPGNTWSVAVVGNYAYLASNGLRVIDISVPGSPVLVSAVETSDYANCVAVAGNYAYVTVGYAGPQIAWRQCESAMNLQISNLILISEFGFDTTTEILICDYDLTYDALTAATAWYING